jgi:hypothetical protein
MEELKKMIRKANEYAAKRYPINKEYLDSGLSLRAIAEKIEELKALTLHDGEKWTATTVKQILKRVEKKSE